MIAKIAAAAALLGMLAGCAAWPGWTPNVSSESPGIYELSPSD